MLFALFNAFVFDASLLTIRRWVMFNRCPSHHIERMR